MISNFGVGLGLGLGTAWNKKLQCSPHTGSGGGGGSPYQLYSLALLLDSDPFYQKLLLDPVVVMMIMIISWIVIHFTQSCWIQWWWWSLHCNLSKSNFTRHVILSYIKTVAMGQNLADCYSPTVQHDEFLINPICIHVARDKLETCA